MPQPGMPSARGDDWLVRKVQELEQRLQQLAAANVFGTTGITPKDGGTDFDGYVNINGPAKITGTLDLPAGIIGNDALASPVRPLAVHDGKNNVALNPGPNVELLRTTVTVPAGFTQALVHVTSALTVYNTASTKDDIYLGVRVNGATVGAGAASQDTGQPAAFCTVPFTGVTLLTGLSGSFYVSTTGSSGANVWPASGSNFINLDMTVLFLR